MYVITYRHREGIRVVRAFGAQSEENASSLAGVLDHAGAEWCIFSEEKILRKWGGLPKDPQDHRPVEHITAADWFLLRLEATYYPEYPEALSDAGANEWTRTE